MTLISIIIPTWNSFETLPITLERLEKQIFRDFEVIIVDNGSLSFNPKKIEENCRSFTPTIVHFEENRGFASACNYGVQLAEGEWLAFLNADAFPEKDWLDQFHKTYTQFPQAAALGSLITQYHHPDLIDGTGDIYNFSGNAWKRGYGYPINTAPTQPERIFSPNAAAAFYKREIFLRVGGFDEDFFSYFEDVDLGFRINLAGGQCIFLPSAHVEHVGSASTGQDSDFAVYHHHRNSDWTFLKNMPGILFFLYLPIRILANLVFFLKYLLHGRGKIVLKAKWDALTKIGSMIKKRRNIQKSRVVSIGETNRLFNKQLFAPFLLGLRLRKYNKTLQKDIMP
ncbi:MAG TPA: glycosyltransferase family 2 protein [Anaerolineaceae bacterium]|nr:glycosyltransferase family 2 protein [Anaerolineaceae bacterium]